MALVCDFLNCVNITPHPQIFFSRHETDESLSASPWAGGLTLWTSCGQGEAKSGQDGAQDRPGQDGNQSGLVRHPEDDDPGSHEETFIIRTIKYITELFYCLIE